MPFLLRLMLIIAGVSLFSIAASGYFLHQDPSTAFWVLGQVDAGDQQTLYLTSPNGGVHRAILPAHQSNRVDILGWLPDSRKLLYKWESDDQAPQIRMWDLDTQMSTIVLPSHQSGAAFEFDKIRDVGSGEWLVLPLSNRQGVAFFRLSRDATQLERITPYYSALLAISLYLSPDQEWLYYEASLGSGTPHVLFRQRFDGSERSELLHFDGTSYIVAPSTSEVYLHIFKLDEEATAIYHLTSDSNEPQLILSQPSVYLNLLSVDQDWLVLQAVSATGQYAFYRSRLDGSDFNAIHTGLDNSDHQIFFEDQIYLN